MKKLLFLIVILYSISCSNSFSQGWVEIFNGVEDFQKDPYYINQIVVNSKHEIFLLCDNFPIDKTSILFKTSDQCKSWISLNLPFNYSLGVYETPMRINSKDDIFIPFDSVIIRTTDGGKSFDTVLNLKMCESLFSNRGQINEFDYLNISPNDVIYLSIIWDGYKIIKSNDNGNTWEIVDTSGDYNIKDLSFAEDGTIWNVYGWGFYKSNDSCQTFQQVYTGLFGSDVFYYPLAVAVGKNNVVFVVDEYGSIIKSTDSGESFELSYRDSINHYSNRQGTIVGSQIGYIFSTNNFSLDNGLTWNTGGGYSLFPIDSTCYTTSSYKIRKFDLILSVDDEYQKRQELNISPNPTHNTAKIEYTIDKPSIIYLKIFDALGNTIKDFYLGEQSPGEYIFNFDTIDLPQGIYFIKLFAGEQDETGKMVVIE